MSNILQNFLAGRAKTKTPVTNDAQAVTRAEFALLAKAVEGLIEDLGTVTSPDKLQAALNSAWKAAMAEKTVSNTFVPVKGHRFTPPSAQEPDGKPAMQTNNKSAFVVPAAE